MDTTRSSRVDRLKENDGGGVNLLLLFTNLLSTVKDDGQITLDTAKKAVKFSHNNQFGMMTQTFRDYVGDGVENYLLAALELLESQDRLIREDNVWKPGPKLVYDAPMRILMNSNRHWTTVKLSSKSAPTITFNSEVITVRSDIHAIARLLEPDAPGLRAVTPEGKEAIKKSLAEYGLMPGYPILKDNTGRILGGRHRMAVERELKADGLWDESWPASWPVQVIYVADDLVAVRIAMAGNRSTPFTAEDFDRLDKLGLGSTKRERQRRLIELALLEEANRSDRAIARLMPGMCHNHTVGTIRRRLEETDQIDQFEFEGGRGVTTGKTSGPQPRKLPNDDESRIIARMKEGLRSGESWGDICLATGFSAHGGDSSARTLRAEAEKQIAVEDAVQAATTATPPIPTLPPDTNDQPPVPATVAQPADPTSYREEETEQPESSPTATQPENYPDRAYVLSLVQQLPIEDQQWLCEQLEDLLNG